jgi:hypothetical protein
MGGRGPTDLRGERGPAEMRSSIRASHLSPAEETFSAEMGTAQVIGPG